MRPGVLLIDCYGTLVESDAPVIETVVADLAARTGLAARSIDRPWWRRFSQLCSTARGDNFSGQYELEAAALADVLDALGRPLPLPDIEAALEPLTRYWRQAAPYPDAVALLASWTLSPIVIVSNIDRADVEQVVRRLPPVAAVVTSEDARAYKPDPEVFAHALRVAQVSPSDAVHVGDSLESDVAGARSAGIDAIWLDRSGAGERAGAGIRTISKLTDLLHA